MKQISSIIVSSTVQGEGLYNRNYTWERGGWGGGGGGGLPGRYKAAMTVMVRLDPCQCFMQLMMLKHLYTYSVYAMWLSLSLPPSCCVLT